MGEKKPRTDAIREYQRRYYLEKIKNRPKPIVEPKKELVFQLPLMLAQILLQLPTVFQQVLQRLLGCRMLLG
jgi:hypothetical protein